MSITRFIGPLVVPGATASLSPVTALDYNDAPGPSMFAHGVSLLDNRYGPFNGGDITNDIPGWYGASEVLVVDAAPAALSATNISAAAVPTAGTPLTLAGASTGITVLPSAFTLFAGAGTVPSGCLVMDGSPAIIQINGANGPAMYDPRTAICRTLRFTSVGNDSGATAAVVGYDFYGNIVHETVTLANAGIATSKKALKFVQSITPAGTLSGANLSVGTSDVYGFGLAAYEFPLVSIFWNNAFITSATGFTAAVTTSPATATTGDVRGTYAVQSASDGTKKLQVFVSPVAWHMDPVGLFGVVQY